MSMTDKVISKILRTCYNNPEAKAREILKRMFAEEGVQVAQIKEWSQDEIDEIPMDSKPDQVEPQADAVEVVPATQDQIKDANKRLGKTILNDGDEPGDAA